MNDKKLTDTLRNIKEYCESCDDCIQCMFYDGEATFNRTICRMVALIISLDKKPSNWDMEKIERIINESTTDN